MRLSFTCYTVDACSYTHHPSRHRAGAGAEIIETGQDPGQESYRQGRSRAEELETGQVQGKES